MHPFGKKSFNLFKECYIKKFNNPKIVDIGALDINGSIKDQILTDFPESDYAIYLSDDPLEREPREQERIIMQAELEMSHDKENAIDLFKSAILSNTNGDYSASAAYAIGYYYDQEAVIDSALKYYSWIKENHPNSEQSTQAISRMNTINFALSFIEADTVDNSTQD